jgi:hypothetical protein
LAAKIALESRKIARDWTPNQSSADSAPNQSSVDSIPSQSSVDSSDNIKKESYSSSDSNKEKETKIPKWFKTNK